MAVLCAKAVAAQRILFLLEQVKKQNIDIQNALLDTRALQKEINSISEKLNRTFALVSELVFTDAKKNETARAAFKDLAKMNESFKVRAACAPPMLRSLADSRARASN